MSKKVEQNLVYYRTEDKEVIIDNMLYTRKEYDLVNNKRHGFLIETRMDSGAISYKAEFRNDECIGVVQWWQKNGRRGYINTINKRKKHGISISFFINFFEIGE